MLLSTKARFVSAFALYLLGNLLRSVLPLSRHPFGSYLFFILLYALIGLILGGGRADRGGGPLLAVGRGVYGSAPASSIGSLPALVPGIGLSCHKPRGDPPRAAVGDLRVTSPPRPAEIITTPGPGQKNLSGPFCPCFPLDKGGLCVYNKQ